MKARSKTALQRSIHAGGGRRASRSGDDQFCTLCGGTIERFDQDVYIVTARCAPCHEALAQD